MPRKEDRLQLSPIGEYYGDLLEVDARIIKRSIANQGSSLLCAKLQEREERIKERVQYLADKRGVTFQQMWNDILTGIFEELSPQEYAELLKQQGSGEALE